MQAARVATVQAAYRKKMAENPREDAPNAQQMRSLGLIDATDEEKNMKRAKWLPSVKSNGAF